MDEYSDLKPIHDVVLGIYKDFKRVCEENNLRFIAISGTTLGAVLWNGFIPWDDDMDIALPVEDYIKLIKLYKNGDFPKYIGLNEYDWFGSKLYDKRTMYTGVYYLNNPDRFSGIFIDIVPLINVPDDKGERTQFIEKMKKFHENGISLDIYDKLDDIKTKKEFYSLKEEILHSYKYGETGFVMDFSDYRYVLDAAGFESPVIFDFEDTEIPVSSGYEKDLRIQYGKYQKYPPKEQRISMHQIANIVDVDVSCEIYAKDLRMAAQSLKNIINVQHKYFEDYEKKILEKEEYIKKLAESNNKILEEYEKKSKEYNKLNEDIEKIRHSLPYRISQKVNSVIDRIRK